VRVLADGETDTQTDANRFYNLSHAICYGYGTDNNDFQPNKYICWKEKSHLL